MENIWKPFYIVEMYPKKLWFDFFCCLDCLRHVFGDTPDYEYITRPETAVERTGVDGMGRVCDNCNESLQGWSTMRLREHLRGLGYAAHIANGECFDINIGGRTHYLSNKEARGLAEAYLPHPVDLEDYVTEKTSLNSWYTFTKEN